MGVVIIHIVGLHLVMMNKISRYPTFNSTYTNIIHTLNESAECRVKSIYEHTKPLVCKYILPIFSIKLINEAKSVGGAIDLALNIRGEGGARKTENERNRRFV